MPFSIQAFKDSARGLLLMTGKSIKIKRVPLINRWERMLSGGYLAAALLCFSLTGCGGPLPPPDPYNLAEAKDSMGKGNYWYERGCYRESERFFTAALESARLSDNVLLIIRAQNSLGTAALAEGDKNGAAVYLEQAINLASAHPEQPELDKVLGNLGALAFQLARLKDAEGFWKQAVEAAEKKGLSPAPYYCDLARLYKAEGRDSEFSAMVAKALAATGEAEPFSRADALNLAGQEAMGRGDGEGAESLFRQALELDRKTENTTGLAQDTESLGLLMVEMKRFGEAAVLLDRSFYLWLAVANDQAADRVLALMKKLAATEGHPKKMEPYLQARRNPAPHRLAKQCP